MNMLITRNSVLYLLFFFTVVLMAGFVLWTPSVGGVGLDGISSVAEIESLLAGMSESEKDSHFWMTLLLDMLFPLAYGGLFAGICLKHAGRYARYLVLPALVVIPVDMLENIIQLLALKDNVSFLELKALLTPTKFFLFYVAAAIASASLLISIVTKGFSIKP